MGREFKLKLRTILKACGVKYTEGKDKVKSSMARSLPVENLLPQNVGSIINYWQ